MTQLSLGGLITALLIFASQAIHNPDPFTPKDEEAFKTFLDSFEEVELPFVLDESSFYNNGREDGIRERDDLLPFDQLDFIPYKRPMYSRMGPDEYMPEAELALSDDFKAIVVAGKRPFERGAGYFHLITYTNEGTPISYKRIAGAYGKSEMVRCTITEVGTVLVETCLNTWDDNKLVYTEVTGTESFFVTETGEIETVEKGFDKPIQEQVKSNPERASSF